MAFTVRVMLNNKKRLNTTEMILFEKYFSSKGQPSHNRQRRNHAAQFIL